MNSTTPAAPPPRSVLATPTPQSTGVLGSREREAAAWGARGRVGGGGRLCGGGTVRGRSARRDLVLLAGVLDGRDLADHLLRDVPVLHHHFRQVLVHDDVPRHRVERDGAAGAVELPALE